MQRKRGIARLLECFACTAAAQENSERSLRLAGAAAALRQNIGAPLPPPDRLRIEEEIEPARAAMGNAASSAAWRSGWALPLDIAIDEALASSVACAQLSYRDLKCRARFSAPSIIATVRSNTQVCSPAAT